MYKKNNRFAQAVAKVNNTAIKPKEVTENKKMCVTFKIDSGSFFSTLSVKVVDEAAIYTYGNIVMYFHIDKAERGAVHITTLRKTFERMWNRKDITCPLSDLADKNKQDYFKDEYMSTFNAYSDIEKQKLLIEEDSYNKSVVYALDSNMNIVDFCIN